MTTDESTDAARRRVASRMKSWAASWNPDSLDDVMHAVRVLCEAKGWKIGLSHDERGGGWYAYHPTADDGIESVDRSGNHAADLCRLVCLVLDREADAASTGGED